MGIFSSAVTLLQNTVETVQLSKTVQSAVVDDVLQTFTPAAIGVYAVDWRIYCNDGPGGVAIKKNGAVFFAPSTLVIPDGGYRVQMSLGMRDALTIEVLTSTANPIYSDLIITQIG